MIQDRHEYLDEIVHAWLRAMAPEADDARAMAIVKVYRGLVLATVELTAVSDEEPSPVVFERCLFGPFLITSDLCRLTLSPIRDRKAAATRPSTVQR